MSRKALLNMRDRFGGLPDVKIEEFYNEYTNAPDYDNTFIVYFYQKDYRRATNYLFGRVIKWLHSQQKVVVRMNNSRKLTIKYHEIDKIEKGL